MPTKKISEFVNIEPKPTFKDAKKVSLSDLDGETVTITAFARSVINSDVAFTFLLDDNREFMTGSMAFVQVGEELVGSDAVSSRFAHDTYQDCNVYLLGENITFKIEAKHNPKTGRDFYRILDPDE